MLYKKAPSQACDVLISPNSPFLKHNGAEGDFKDFLDVHAPFPPHFKNGTRKWASITTRESFPTTKRTLIFGD